MEGKPFIIYSHIVGVFNEKRCNMLKLYINKEPEIIRVKPFIIITGCAIVLFSSESVSFISFNDFENIKTEPNKQEDIIIHLRIILLYEIFLYLLIIRPLHIYTISHLKCPLMISNPFRNYFVITIPFTLPNSEISGDCPKSKNNVLY